MERETENTVLLNATSQTASENIDWMKDEAKYQVTVAVFLRWLQNGIITKKEFGVIETKMRAKYHPKIGSLLFE